MKRMNIIGIGLLFVLSLVTSVAASGVSSPYFPGNPALVEPGAKGEFNMAIQNMVGDEDLIFEVNLLSNEGNVVSINEKRYEVPAGTSDTYVRVRYEIPEEATPGTTYNVLLSFETVTPGESGGVAMGQGMEMKIPFQVIEPSPEPAQSPGISTATYAAMLTAVFIIVVVVVFLVYKKKKNAAGYTTDKSAPLR